ncbi:riboflavin synthase subunit alpha [Hydrococcus rivularis NIES-593]|uniref:Riboflavin synthase subunit alpha n=1 Tax=Hydrococcus rivularis NIES-593 TaxID=1921803 RepID=A0A1U7HML3_9CYAN|nr:riboflavin synthase subunit alpha [Hydrococcus rivularis]OKH24826.1 riboflavin synthase subunit alpha [Hydrococcus rivularis NIES-593]
MLVLSLITLAIASVAAFVSFNTREEVVKAAMGFTAVIFSFLTLLLAPWALKLAIVAIPLALDRINNWSTEKSIN